MQRLSGDEVRHKLATRVFGQNVYSTDQTGSTNTELKKLAQQGAPEGMLYLTEEQLGGQGRLGRPWHAPAGSSLLLSLLFRPGNALNPGQVQRLTMLCAIALVDAIERETGLIPDLKWPNDVMWKDGKKLAGILTEIELDGQHLAWVVVGIGLNVNVDFYELAQSNPVYKAGNGSPPLEQTATSLSMILGHPTERLPILQRFLENIEQRYEALRTGRLPHDEWRRRLMGLGQQATVSGAGQVYKGVIAGVDVNGALLLKQADGTVVTITAGDVSLRFK